MKKYFRILIISILCLVVLSFGMLVGCNKSSNKKSMDDLDGYDNVIDGSGLSVDD